MSEAPQRMIRLLSLFQSRRDWTSEELAERLDVTTRTVRRDIERIRELGYQVSASPGVAGGYSLSSGRALPPLILNEAEAMAVALSLRVSAGGGIRGVDEAALSALVKLEQVLPRGLQSQVKDVKGGVESYTGPTPIVESEVLGVIAAACRNQDEVTFEYVKRSSDAAERRRVEAHKIIHVNGRWYLISWDLGREDWRTFRLDRMSGVARTGRTYADRPFPAEDAADYIRKQILSPLAAHHARVLFYAPYNVVADRLRVRDGVLEDRTDGTSVLQTAAESLPRLAASLASVDIDFKVIDSPELAEHLRRLNDRFAAAVGSDLPAKGAAQDFRENC